MGGYLVHSSDPIGGSNVRKNTAKEEEPLGGSPGLVVIGGDSCFKGREFEYQYCILNGHFSLFVVNFVTCV